MEPPCPDGWVRRGFGEILDEVRRPANLDLQAEYQLVNAKRNRGGIAARERLLGRDIKVKSQFYVHPGDFVMSKRQIVHGGCGVVPAELDGSIVSNEYLVVRPSKELRIDYLSYLSHTAYFQRTCFHSSIGVDVEKMVFKEDQWMRFRLPVPRLPEQRKIAAILSSVDDVIEKTEAVIEQLQVVKKAMMQELLTRGIPGRHTRFRQTEIGEIPEEWEVVLLDTVARRGSGHTPDKKHPEYWNGEVKWVSLKDSSQLDRLYISDTRATITPEGIANSSAVEHPRGTVVLSRDAGVGKSAITRDVMAVSQHFMAWTCGPTLDNHFLYHWLQLMKGEFERIAVGSTIKTIGLPYFKKLLIPLPPLDEQQIAAKALTATERRIFAEQSAVGEVRAIKAALMSVLLTGEVRVTPDKESA